MEKDPTLVHWAKSRLIASIPSFSKHSEPQMRTYTLFLLVITALTSADG